MRKKRANYGSGSLCLREEHDAKHRRVSIKARNTAVISHSFLLARVAKAYENEETSFVKDRSNATESMVVPTGIPYRYSYWLYNGHNNNNLWTFHVHSRYKIGSFI